MNIVKTYIRFILKISSLYSALLLMINCKTYHNSILKNGDLLFVPAVETGLSGAINNVTQTKKKTSYDHIGIVKIEDNKTYVLHAAPKDGSQKQKLSIFVKNQTKNGQTIDVFRLVDNNEKLIYQSISKAESLLGKPYNFDYILSDNSYYCSDFVERAFRDFGVFKLEPMTFIDPSTGKTNAFWEKFYAEKNVKVPEGELGCNPNGLAASDNIKKIGELK